MTNRISCLQSQIALNKNAIRFFEEEISRWSYNEDTSAYTYTEVVRMRKHLTQYVRNQKVLKKLLAYELSVVWLFSK